MTSQLDKAILVLKEEYCNIFHFSYHDKEYCDGKKNGIKLAINRLEELKEEVTNE